MRILQQPVYHKHTLPAYPTTYVPKRRGISRTSLAFGHIMSRFETLLLDKAPLDEIRKYLDTVSDINSPRLPYMGKARLMTYAVFEQREDVIQELLKRGADTSYQAEGGPRLSHHSYPTLIHLALAVDAPLSLIRLVAGNPHGQPIEGTSFYQNAPIFEAIHRGRSDVVEFLVNEQGVDPRKAFESSLSHVERRRGEQRLDFSTFEGCNKISDFFYTRYTRHTRYVGGED